jgi:Zn-dependent protease with chaperone function
MRQTEAALVPLARMALPLACAALLVGCTTSPTSGRSQFNILPGALETTVPDLRFEVNTLLTAAGDYCPEDENPCPAREAAEGLARRIAPIAERLGTSAALLSPELVSRIPRVEVFVVPGDSPKVSSSAGGKIAVGAGLSRLALGDTDLALALAREFGRLAAAHHRESASAGLAVSLIAGSPLTSAYLATSILADILFPIGALAKIGISLLASMGTEQLVESSQQDEADAFAAKLLLAAGYDLQMLAVPLPEAPQGGLQIGWLASYSASRAKVLGMGQPDPWPDEAPAPVLAMAPDPWPDEAPPPVNLAAATEPWSGEAQPLVIVALVPEPWPDEAPEKPQAEAGTPATGPETVARVSAPDLADKDAPSGQAAPPARVATAAPAATKPAVKKTRKKPRKTQKVRRTSKKNKRR